MNTTGINAGLSFSISRPNKEQSTDQQPCLSIPVFHLLNSPNAVLDAYVAHNPLKTSGEASAIDGRHSTDGCTLSASSSSARLSVAGTFQALQLIAIADEKQRYIDSEEGDLSRVQHDIDVLYKDRVYNPGSLGIANGNDRRPCRHSTRFFSMRYACTMDTIRKRFKPPRVSTTKSGFRNNPQPTLISIALQRTIRINHYIAAVQQTQPSRNSQRRTPLFAVRRS